MPRNAQRLPSKPFEFSKVLRLTRKREFDAVFKQRTFKVSVDIALAYVLISDNERSRVGISVSKKIGSAPKRNYCKRIVREWFRQTRQHFKKNIDLVVIPQSKKFHELPHAQHRIMFDELLKQINRRLA